MWIQELRTFCILVETQSYVITAQKLGLEHSTVSRQIDRLEKHYGARLVNGNPRNFSLTYEGELLYREALILLEVSDRATLKVRESKDTLAGPLKVLVSLAGMHWFAHHATQFHSLYPEIELELCRDEVGNILQPSTISGMTIGLVSFQEPKDSPFIWQDLGTLRLYPYAHPDYLEQYGNPKTWEDLDHHKLIRYQWAPIYRHIDPVTSNVLLYGGNRDQPRPHCIIADDILSCRSLIERKLGIGVIPHYLAKDTILQPTLIEAYDPRQGFSNTLKLVYPPALKNFIRVETFIKFVREKAQSDGLME